MQCNEMCEDGTEIKINNCDDNNDRQVFTVMDETIHPAGDTNLCLTATSLNSETESVELKPCNGLTNQKFYGFNEQAPFQLRPRTGMMTCLTMLNIPQQHERVFPQNCERPEESDTSLWIAE